jgi:hypothetical protein
MIWSPLRSRLLLITTVVSGIAGGWYFTLRNQASDRELKEKSITLSGHPIFQSDAAAGPAAILVAVLDSDSGKRRFPWPQQALPAGEIPLGKPLRFTFYESPDSSLWPLELSRIEDDSGTLFDGSICLIHRQTMHRTRVRTLPASEPISPTITIEDSLFPHSGLVHTRPGMDRSDTPVWVCDSCQRERDRWLDKARQTASVSN